MSRKNKKEKNKKTQKSGGRFYRICYAALSGIVGCCMRIHVVNPEAEPDTESFLVCSNHIGATDPIILSYAFRCHQVRFMAKKELFKIPVLAQLIRMFGAFPVDRGGTDVGAIRHAISLLQEKKCMGIFPQGHRYPGVEPRTTSTKNGAAMICLKAQADVVPMYIYRKNRTPKLFRKTYVIFGERIPYAELEKLCEGTGDYARVSAKIFDDVCTLGERLEKEVAGS